MGGGKAVVGPYDPVYNRMSEHLVPGHQDLGRRRRTSKPSGAIVAPDGRVASF